VILSISGAFSGKAGQRRGRQQLTGGGAGGAKSARRDGVARQRIDAASLWQAGRLRARLAPREKAPPRYAAAPFHHFTISSFFYA
jgi:hypothetical protein